MSETVEQAGVAPGEVRTFLIADLRGYTRFTVEHGDEAAARVASRFAAIARHVVGAQGGEVIELRGDEALAVFSSARQALRAAVALSEELARQSATDPGRSLRAGIGLDSGEAVPVDGGYRGGALNLAARLCSLAGPGEVLASEGVTHLARKVEGLLYAERGAVELKGFDDPVRVVEVRNAALAAPSPSGPAAPTGEPESRLPVGGYLGSLPANPVVGRESEMERALEIVEAVIRGEGKLLLLVGEPGVGKTRLAQEVTLQLRDRDFCIAAGRCYEPQQTVPFYPFLEALTALYAAAPESIRRRVPVQWPDLARLLPVLGLPIADHAGPQDQQRLFWAVTGFVEAVAQTAPVALLLDDLHWADAASLELLQHLARHTARDRVLLLGTYRDVEVNRRHPLEAALRDLQREGLVERIEVRRLGREATCELIGAVMGEEEISDEFADLLYGRTEGNAFFVQQVLRGMVERGDVFRKDGRWDRKAVAELEVPESVRSVVGQRLSRLAEETQETLREASVLGQTFEFDDLQAMSGRGERDLERGLDEAMGAGMVRETGRDAYAFDHALTQAALYAELSGRRKRRLHLQAGEALEALPERKREGRAAELAWHFLEGDDAARALRWSLAAGGGAEAVFAHSDAEHHYRTAIQLAAELGESAIEMEARENLGRVLSNMARNAEALEITEPALPFYREKGDLAAEIRLTANIGWILFEQVRRDEGIELLGAVLERWEQEPLVSAPAASLHVALGNLYWHAGRLEQALRLLERASELATEVGDDRLLGMAEGRRGTILNLTGRWDEAQAAYARAIPLLEAAGDLGGLNRSYSNRAVLHLTRGRPREAREDLERALAVARRLGDPSGIGWTLGSLMHLKWMVDGHWDAVRPHVEEMIRLLSQLRGNRASGHVTEAVWLRFIAGGDRAALHDLASLAEEGEREGDVALWQFAQYYLAGWDVLEGRAEWAVERYEAVLAHPEIESQGVPIFEKALAWACAACGRLERAEALSTAELEKPHRLPYFPWPMWPAIRARLRAEQGRREEARAGFEEALSHARERGYPIVLGETAHAYGEALARWGETDAAREQFEEAVEVFRRMNAGPYVERAERALVELSASVGNDG